MWEWKRSVYHKVERHCSYEVKRIFLENRDTEISNQAFALGS